MGIRYLNKYLKDNCSNASIQCISLAKLSGKKIVVDTSIYMYKFESENMLLENMYVLLSLLRHYNIIAIFIFDGKAPIEKKMILEQRSHDRKNAELEYKQLEEKLMNVEEEEKKEIIDSMDQLKKKIVYITKEKIENVKKIITYFGSSYYDAPGESDELCALLMHHKIVWACLSEDMDMFVYGCERVLRYFSLIHHNVVLYTMKNILQDLQMTQKEFREVCVLSGTDYQASNTSLFEIIKYFKKYQHDKKKIQMSFYDSIKESMELDIETLEKINNIFDMKLKVKEMPDIHKIKIVNTQIQYHGLSELLKNDGFIFVY